VLDIPGSYGPRGPLPLQVRFLARESTGSFVNRLAHRNGLELHEFLERAGQGKASESPERIKKYPQYTEMYVNRAGLRYLAVLTDRPDEALQRALPSLGERHLLPGEEEAAWRWPWEPHEGHIVRCCALCAHRRGAGEPVWLMSPDSWRVCLRHLHWTDNSRQVDPCGVRLGALPETAEAHQRRERLRRRFGPAGEELFADAFQVVVHWWTSMPETIRWVQRAWSVGLEAREMRVVPLVIYPEAVELAVAMLRFEQADERDSSGRARWLVAVQRLMDRWGVDFMRGKEPLLRWLERHSKAAPARTRSPRRRRLTLSLEHNLIATQTGSLDKRSCLPWQLGMSTAEL